MDILGAVMADPNISPAFKAAIAQDAMPVRRATYVSDLLRFDWHFEQRGNDGWQRGMAELERLRTEREQVDPDHALWNRHAHEDFRHE